MAALLLAALLWAAPARAAVVSLPGGGSALPVLAPVSLSLGALPALSGLRSPLSLPALAPALPRTAAPLLAPSVLPRTAAPLPAPSAMTAAPQARASLTAVAAQVAPSAGRSRDSSAALGAFWDGSHGKSAGAVAAGMPVALSAQGITARSKGGVPWAADTRAQGADLDRILAAARQSPTASGILDSMDKLLKATGRTVPVRFAALGNNLGEYDYLRGILFLDNRYRRGDTRQAVATLAHEFLHILQHAQKVPSEALEMELEAHIVSLRILDELGVAEADRDGFSRAATRELRKGPGDFIAWMRTQLSGKLYLKGTDVKEIVANLKDDADDAADRISELEDRLADQDSPRLRENLKREQALLDSIRGDIAALRSPAGRKRYDKFSRRVHAVVQSYQRELTAGR